MSKEKKEKGVKGMENETAGTSTAGPGGVEPVKEMLSIFKALSDETRLRMLKLLEGGELCVCHVVAAFDMSQSKVSFHLGTLKAAGLVKDRKEGKWMHYRIDDSDLFRRLLVLSVAEKFPGDMMKEDRKRLRQFIETNSGVLPMAGWCCRDKGQ